MKGQLKFRDVTEKSEGAALEFVAEDTGERFDLESDEERKKLREKLDRDNPELD